MDESQPEEVLLDEDAEAANHDFWDMGGLEVGALQNADFPK